MKILSRIITEGALFSGRSSAIVRENQIAAMHEATQFVTRKVKSRTPQGVMGAQGGLLSTIQPEVRDTTNRVIGSVATASMYGLVVEKGRRPGRGFPPKGCLVRWIEVKMGVSEDEAKGIEIAVRRKIAKKGTQGAHMFEETLEKDFPEIQRIFQRYGVVISRRLTNE